eukprot:6210474-Pleurochrysis_carterae.AAC.2
MPDVTRCERISDSSEGYSRSRAGGRRGSACAVAPSCVFDPWASFLYLYSARFVLVFESTQGLQSKSATTEAPSGRNHTTRVPVSWSLAGRFGADVHQSQAVRLCTIRESLFYLRSTSMPYHKFGRTPSARCVYIDCVCAHLPDKLRFRRRQSDACMLLGP